MESDQFGGCANPGSITFLSTLSAWRATMPSMHWKMHKSAFLSTLSAWRATQSIISYIYTVGYFYPRSPHGERLPSPPARETPGQISIHALRMESDWRPLLITRYQERFLSTLSAWRATWDLWRVMLSAVQFLSTLSAWRATWLYQALFTSLSISIHALRMESDC